MAEVSTYNPRKTYARKLVYYLKSEKCMGLLVLRFGPLGMRERERDELRITLKRSGCDEVFIGRMNHLKGVIRASKLPVTAHYIDQCITANSILVFAVPSCHKWVSIMKAVSSLVISNKCNLMIHRFFLGHTEFPVRIFEGAIQGVCDCHNLPSKDLSHAIRWFTGGPSPLQDAAATMHFHNKLKGCVMELMLNTYSCLLFELHRVIHDLIGKGHGLFVCGQMDVVFHEIIDQFLLEFIGVEDSVCVLDKVLEIWQVYPQFLNRCHQFFAVLDIIMHWSVVQTGYSRWITYFINAPNVSLTKRSLELVLCLRSGKSIDVSVLQHINHMLMELNMYIDMFEVPFILDTTIYYQSIADTLLVCEGIDYVTVLSSMMSVELSSASYTVGDTKGKMLDLFRGILLNDTFDMLKTSLCTYDVRPFSESACVHHLSKIFVHLEMLPHGRQLLVPGIRICFDVTTAFFEGKAVNLDSMIKYMDHCKFIIHGAFNNDGEILEALNESMSKVLNFTSELKEIYPLRIAAYLNERIQVCSKVGTVDEEIGKVLLLIPLLEKSTV